MVENGRLWRDIQEPIGFMNHLTDSITNEIYVGEFKHVLDVKGRLTLPSKWRFETHMGQLYLALPNPIGCVTIYPPKMIKKLEEKVSQVSLGDKQGQKVLTKLFSKADSFFYDKQGRVLLNEHLMKHSRIEKSALLVGNYVTFSIWNPIRYEEYSKQSDGEEDEIHSILRGLGL
jgi:MraZ protein